MQTIIRTLLVCGLLAFGGETVVGPIMSVKGIAPNFAVIALVVYGLASGGGAATAAGFMVGLVQDLSNPALLGLQALCMSVLGFSVGGLRGRLMYGVPLVEGVVVALAVVGHDFLYLLGQSSLTDEQFLLPLLTRTIPVAVYSGLVGVPVIRLMELLGVLRQED